MIKSEVQNQSFKWKLALLLMLIFSSVKIIAGETLYPFITSAAIVVGDEYTNMDGLYPLNNTSNSWVGSNNIRYQSVDNHVVLRVDQQATTVQTDYVLSATLEVSYKEEDGTTQIISPNPKLTITYHSNPAAPYNDKHIFTFTGGHEVKVKVLTLEDETDPNNIITLTTAPSNVIIENNIKVNRLFDFNYTTAPAVPAISVLTPSSELKVDWNPVQGAELYHLEWLFVNNYSAAGDVLASDLEYNFRNNATRISTTNTTYKLSNVFEQGYVLFRYRALTYDGPDQANLVAGEWSEPDFKIGGPNNKKQVSLHQAKFQVTTAHETDDFNWQYTANYAEEGKKKEAVSYFDGSLRNRQVVSRINTDEKTIVGETFYDHQGRAAIQALPVPVEDLEDIGISYYDAFNKNLAGNAAYSKDNFDKDYGNCAILAEPMSDGAAKYYSAANPDKTGYQAYVPDAAGYPFTHVEYEPDNTGRIRRQGGVGPVHQLSTDPANSHETKYIYGKPSQEHLNRLFGAEVGFKAHYKKNMVIDANGQISVSYLDQQGRVIATSLAGNTPDNVNPLPSNKEENRDEMTLDVLDNRPGVGNVDLVSTYHHIVTTDGPHDFDYNLIGETFNDLDALPEGVCLDCVYDIVIDVTDECGDRPVFVNISDPTITSLPIVKTIGTIDDLCQGVSTYGVDFTLDLYVGKYTITRTLTVNSDYIDESVIRYLGGDNNNITPLEDFIDSEMALIDFSQCADLDCEESCLLSLDAGYTAEELAACELDCEFPDLCTGMLEILKGDFFPGGQYATYKIEEVFDANNQLEEINYFVQVDNISDKDHDRGSVLFVEEYDENGALISPTNELGLGNNYKNPTLQYLDPDGTPSIVYIEEEDENGEVVVVAKTPQELTLQQFVENFKRSWTDVLVQFHPEYCYVQYCESVTDGLKFDYLMRSIDTYEEALALNLLNPLNLPAAVDPTDDDVPDFGTNAPNPFPFAGVWPIFAGGVPPTYNTSTFSDPFFESLGSTHPLFLEMKNYLTDYEILDDDQTTSLFSGTVWEAAVAASGVCESQTVQADCDLLIDGYTYYPFNQTDPCTRDKMWLVFRSLYLAKKQMIFDESLAVEMANQGCGSAPSIGLYLESEGCMSDPDCVSLVEESTNNYEDESNCDYIVNTANCPYTEFGFKTRRIRKLLEGMGEIAGVMDGTTTTADAATYAQDGVDLQCVAKAEGGAMYWMDKLSGCADPSVWQEGNVVYDDVKAGFIEVYIEACSAEHPFGASTLPTGTTSPSGYTSFQNVLETVLPLHGLSISQVCNIDLLGSPKPYENDIFPNAEFSVLDGCGCDNILQAQYDYSNDPNTTLTGSEYFANIWGVYLDSYDRKVCACNDAFSAGGNGIWSPTNKTWNQASLDELAVSGEAIPNSVGCSVCLGCLDIVPAYNTYLQSLATDYGITGDYRELEADELQPIMHMITNHLNNTLNLELTYLEYMDFIADCEAVDAGTYQCVEISELGFELQEFISKVVIEKTMPLECPCNDLETYGPFLGLFDLTPQDCESITQTITTVGDPTYQFVINNSCDVSISIDAQYDITRLVPPVTNIRVDESQLPLNPNEPVPFLLDAQVIQTVGGIDQLVDVTLYGTTSCFDILDCNEEPITLCNMQPDNNYTPDACEELLINMAVNNATNLYTTYIEVITTALRDEIEAQCLAAVDNEVFDMHYLDNEHHYTLYYYDQAGNLIKTVPPEGVEFVDAGLWNQINTDRANGVRSIFTEHRMATQYKYNSLNQLTQQSVPDHESFNLSQVMETGTGLPIGMEVSSVSFGDENNGVLFGSDPDDPNKSLIFTTPDGGNSWIQVTDLGIKNLNAVLRIGTTIFGVGDQGTYIKSIDNGANWTVVNIGTTDDLVGIHMKADLLTGTILTTSGGVYNSTDGISWTGGSSLSDVAVTSEMYFDSDEIGYAVGIGTYAGQGTIHKTIDGGLTWNEQIAIGDANLRYISMYNQNIAIATGDDGRLLKTINGGQDWQQFYTAVNVDIVKSIFTSSTSGIALDANGDLWKVTNSGATFSPISLGTNVTAIDFALVNGSGSSFTGFVLTDDYRLFRSQGLLSWQPTGQITTTETLSSIFFEDEETGYALGTSGTMYQTANHGVTWNNINPDVTDDIKEVAIVDGAPGAFNIPSSNAKGVLLTATGKLYTTQSKIKNWTEETLPANFNAIDISMDESGVGYALSSDGQVLAIQGYGGSISAVSAVTLVQPLMVDYANGTVMVLGDGGKLLVSTDQGANWADYSQNVLPLPLAGVHAVGSDVAAVGSGGTALTSNDQGVTWTVETSGTSNTLTSVQSITTNSLAVGTVKGELRYASDLANNTWVDVSTPFTNQPINHVGVSGTAAVVVTQSGKIGYVADIMAASPVVTEVLAQPEPLNHVIVSGNEALAVGDNGTIYSTLASNDLTSWSLIGNDTKPDLITASFKASNGTYYTVSHNGVIGSSSDGGSTWNFTSTSATNLKAIHFYGSTGVAVGDDSYVYTTDGGLSWSSFTVLNDFNDVYLLSNTVGFVVTEGGSLIRINPTVNYFSNSVNYGNALNSIDFAGNAGFVAGDNGTLLYTDQGISASANWTPLLGAGGLDWVSSTDPVAPGTTANLNDIVAQDENTLYAVGDNGIIIKSTDGGMNWIRRDSETTEHLNELAFSDEGEAIISASNNTNTVPKAIPFVDKTDRFSTRFYYDKLGRLVASQNSKQFHATPQRFSYSKYDELSRPIEVGELIYANNNVLYEPSAATLNADTYPNNWSTNRQQVTNTYYDHSAGGVAESKFTGGVQQHLRGRVAYTTYEEVYDGADNTYDHATHYSYDIHGNVNELLQDNPQLAYLDQQYKKITYEFDLISGNVNMVAFQPGALDQFYHKYTYDGDNRITDVLTSSDGITWDREAAYEYYQHGPLARTVIGDLQVQGVDYAYTLQGWLKGVNSATLNETRDMGRDGNGNMMPKDVFGFNLGYYSNDYTSISSDEAFLAELSGSQLETDAPALYNGNISSMITAISPTPEATEAFVPVQGNAYRYDEMNRLAGSKSYSNSDAGMDYIAASNTFVGATANGDYDVNLTYDANGNIATLTRNGYAAHPDGQTMDQLSYIYETDINGKKINNKLLHVNDGVAVDAAVPVEDRYDDITDQGVFDARVLATHNYTYDEIGNLISDRQEDIAEIVWNNYGKVTQVKRTTGSTADDLLFKYDASGNRVMKVAFHKNMAAGTPDITYTHYIREVSGKVMAIYTVEEQLNETSEVEDKMTVKEYYIYGNSRLGARKSDQVLVTSTQPLEGINSFGERIKANNTLTITTFDPAYATRMLGNKNYELSNHLGNVLATVSDMRIPLVDGANTIIGYVADVTSSNDYYPFGSIIPGRNYSSPDYRYGFNGMEKDDEVKGSGNSYTFGARIYDPRLGRWLSVDPYEMRFPGVTTYRFALNNPLMFIDPEGQTEFTFHTRHFIPTSTVAGGWFRGDGRGFSTSLEVTSRINHQVTVDTEKLLSAEAKTWSDPTKMYLWKDKGIEATAEPKGGIRSQSKSGRNLSVHTEYSAQDPLAPVAPYIDFSTFYSISEDTENKTLDVKGSVSGELFPAVESFISDSKGVSVFLGVRGAEGSITDDYGKGNEKLIDIDIRINLDEEGNFTSVVSDGQEYSIEDWNSKFENEPAEIPESKDDNDE